MPFLSGFLMIKTGTLLLFLDSSISPMIRSSGLSRTRQTWSTDPGSNLTIVSYRDTFFDVYVGVDLGILSNLASVQVYLIMNPGVLAYDRLLDHGEFRASHLFRGY